MNGTAFVMLSGMLTFGIPLLLAVRELYELKRRGKGSWDGDGPTPIVPPPRQASATSRCRIVSSRACRTIRSACAN